MLKYDITSHHFIPDLDRLFGVIYVHLGVFKQIRFEYLDNSGILSYQPFAPLMTIIRAFLFIALQINESAYSFDGNAGYEKLLKE